MELTTNISRFQYEDMCCIGDNTFPLSTVCNAKCLFCSNKMNPFKIHRVGFRPESEVLSYVFHRAGRVAPDAEVRLSDVIPGRLSEGEAMLHPKFFEMCKLIRSRLPDNPLHITTNGSMLTEEAIGKLAKLRPFNITISYHSHNVDHWTKIFGLSEKQYETATKAFDLCKQAKFGLTSAIVVLPNLVGYDDARKTLLFMNDHGSQCVQLWEPGYSKYATEEQLELMTVDRAEFKKFVYQMYKECTNMLIYWDKDPDKPIDIQPYEYMKYTHKFDKVMWLTAELGYERLKKLVAKDSEYMPNKHWVQPVPNVTYGGNIDCNGLLMIADMRRAILQSDEEPDLIISPKNMLDSLGCDLMGEHHSNIADQHKVWWRN